MTTEIEVFYTATRLKIKQNKRTLIVEDGKYTYYYNDIFIFTKNITCLRFFKSIIKLDKKCKTKNKFSGVDFGLFINRSIA